MNILGIETSCDETAASVVTDKKEILSNVVLSQIEEHAPYGGVVPEIAARAHADHLDRIITQAMDDAGMDYSDLDGIAATTGPGLIGGLIVGLMMGKGLAHAAGKPFIAVNHLEGHALTARLTSDVSFPFLLLLVSGGHCQVLAVEGVGKYRRYGTTLDDAIGEAFDKTAKMLGLGYPGGPIVERRAREGNVNAYDFPIPLAGRPGCDFSLSGLKTAVWRQVEKLKAEVGSQKSVVDSDVNNICASFQRTCGDILVDRMNNAMAMFRADFPQSRTLVIAGGVAANQYLRGRLELLAGLHNMTIAAPPIKLCTDNAAMIAWAGVERMKAGLVSPLTTAPRARWPLDEKVVAFK